MDPETAVPTPLPPAPKFPWPVLIISSLVSLIVGFTLAKFLLAPASKLSTPQVPPTPSELLSTLTPDQTANWKTLNVVDGNGTPLGVQYKAPPDIFPQVPGWVNAGRYYQTFNLNAPSQVAVIPVGPSFGYQLSYPELEKVYSKFTLKPTQLGQHSAVEVRPSTEGLITGSDLLLLSPDIVKFRGVYTKVTDKLSLVVIHYYDKASPTTEADYQKDERTFDQILSTFKFTGKTPEKTADGCATGGCSGQLCGEKGTVERIITHCAYLTEYGCYNSYSTCERQANGACGWTETEQLKSCLEKNR